MDKQEKQKEIDQANLDISATNQRISKLREEIAEAEKPKLGHGDFGISIGNNPYVVVSQSCIPFSPKAIFSDTSGQARADENMPVETRLGNIFDLLKNDEFLEMIATLKRKQS